MAIEYIKVIDADKLDCTIEYLKNMDIVNSWAKSVGIRAANGIRTDGYTYLTIDTLRGRLDSTLQKPHGQEIEVEYERSKWAVKDLKLVKKEVVTIGGRNYFAEDVAEALSSVKEVIC